MALGTVLITGAEVADRYEGNRGAEQLLRATCSRLRGMGFQPAVVAGKVDSYLVSDLGLFTYIGNPRVSWIDRVTPVGSLRGYVGSNGLSGVLDASGFALGDPWGPRTSYWLARKYSQWKAAGVPIVLLPQAFGPFEQPDVRRFASDALSNATLSFPRDSRSREYVDSLATNVRMGSVTPDITIAEGESLTPKAPDVNRLSILPNWNLSRQNSVGSYVDSLTFISSWAFDNGLQPVGVLHEGAKDLELLLEVQRRVGLRIKADLTGWEMKKYLASSRMVVSARYHGVVAALSSGVPVVAHSWSHKYGELLTDFGVEDWLRDPLDGRRTVAALEAMLVDPKTRLLQDRKEILSTRIELMWSEIREILVGNPFHAADTVGA